VFGKGKVNNKTVKYYLKNNVFLTKALKQAERQIKMGEVKFLEKLAHTDNIGTYGYSYGLQLLRMHHHLFDKAIRSDRMFRYDEVQLPT
jgi:hypothetical protein